MDRQFTKEEARQIFAAAAQLQQHAARESEQGLTLQELEEAAQEAGIDPAFVRVAAVELSRPGHTDVRKTRLGLGIERRRSILLPGRLTDETWTRVVLTLRDVFDSRGVTTDLGTIYEWSSHAEKSKMPYHVTAEVSDEGTRVTIERSTVEQSLGFLYATGPLTLLGVILLIVALAGGGAPLDGVAAFLAISFTMLVAGYATSHIDGKKEIIRFDQILEAFKSELLSDETQPPEPLGRETGGNQSAPDALLATQDPRADEPRRSAAPRRTRS